MPDILNDHDGVCRGCVLGKNVKGSFPSSSRRSKGILDFVHSVSVVQCELSPYLGIFIMSSSLMTSHGRLGSSS